MQKEYLIEPLEYIIAGGPNGMGCLRKTKLKMTSDTARITLQYNTDPAGFREV